MYGKMEARCAIIQVFFAGLGVFVSPIHFQNHPVTAMLVFKATTATVARARREVGARTLSE